MTNLLSGTRGKGDSLTIIVGSPLRGTGMDELPSPRATNLVVVIYGWSLRGTGTDGLPSPRATYLVVVICRWSLTYFNLTASTRDKTGHVVSQ